MRSRIATEYPRRSRERIYPAANLLPCQVFGDDGSPASTRRWSGPARSRDPTDEGVRWMIAPHAIELIRHFVDFFFSNSAGQAVSKKQIISRRGGSLGD
jgi:hypothetical protein